MSAFTPDTLETEPMTMRATIANSWRRAGAAVLLPWALTTTGAWAQEPAADPWARQLSIQQTGIAGVAAAPAAPAVADPLRVTAWVDNADSTYAVGETVQLFVQTNKDAYVTVLNVGPTGATIVLFPNQYQADNRVAANTVVRVPDPASGTEIRVSGPIGAELVKVIASTRPRDPFGAGQLGRAGAFQSVAGSADVTARNLAVALADPTGGEWDDYNKTIRTVERRPAAAPGTVTGIAAAPGTAWPAPAFGLRLASDRTAYRLVEPVTLMVEAERDCHLTLVNTGPNGDVRQIFPNRYQQQTRIQAGQTVVVPGLGAGVSIRPMGPAGLETVTAICRAGDSVPAGMVTRFEAEAFPRLADPAVRARNLAVITSPPAAPAGAGAATALATVTFVVVQ